MKSSNVVEVISEYLAESPVLSVQKTMLRRVPPAARPTWHQDGSFLGERTRTVNTWTALSVCGEGTDAPGLAILPRRLTTSIRGETRGADIAFSPEQLASAGEGMGPVYLRFEPGDALLFDHLLAHANGGGQPGLKRNRYALETWMFAPSSMPSSYLPIAV